MLRDIICDDEIRLVLNSSADVGERCKYKTGANISLHTVVISVFYSFGLPLSIK